MKKDAACIETQNMGASAKHIVPDMATRASNGTALRSHIPTRPWVTESIYISKFADMLFRQFTPPHNFPITCKVAVLVYIYTIYIYIIYIYIYIYERWNKGPTKKVHNRFRPLKTNVARREGRLNTTNNLIWPELGSHPIGFDLADAFFSAAACPTRCGGRKYPNRP